MQSAILYQPPTGCVCVVALSMSAKIPEETEAAFISRMADAYVPAGLKWVAVDNSTFPVLPPETWTVDWSTGEITATPPPPAVPQSVTRAQAKIQLSRAGLLDQVKAAVASAGGETQIWFDEALDWRRDDPRIAAIGTALGLTSGQIDDLFTAAAQIA